jgi:hypothetical protein
MLFRTLDGKFVEINKYDFKNDKLYYEKIKNIYKQFGNQTSVDNQKQDSNKNTLRNQKPLSKL